LGGPPVFRQTFSMRDGGRCLWGDLNTKGTDEMRQELASYLCSVRGRLSFYILLGYRNSHPKGEPLWGLPGTKTPAVRKRRQEGEASQQRGAEHGVLKQRTWRNLGCSLKSSLYYQ